MHRFKQANQQGFGHLGIIVLIVVIVVVGSIGGFVWKRHQKQAHASSLEYRFGRYFQIRDSSKYNRLLIDGYACKWSSNTLSVFSIRRGLINNVTYGIATSQGNVTTPQIYSQWWYNMNLARFSTVANGHNYMGYASARLHGSSWANNGYGSGTVELVATSTLPACHY